MTETALPGAGRWPNVPACYGWLSLDRRGRWRLQGEVVQHAGLRRFLDLYYSADSRGCWRVQNGPQQVFVSLAYTPWVLHFTGDGGLQTHTGQPAGPVQHVWLDEEGAVLLQTATGIGLLDDRDWPGFYASCLNAAAQPADEADWLAFMAGQAVALYWQTLPVGRLRQAEVAGRFAFVAEPQA
ncbi:MAG: hypothetical protein RIR00_828 [Pseudomonadota bacterium]|jgi:hypothetical protein